MIDRIALDRLQILDYLVEHRVKWCSGQIHHLVLLLDGIAVEGHVLKGADEIEVSQRAEGCHLSDGGIDLALGIGRVSLAHEGCHAYDDIALVDNRIEVHPLGIWAGGEEVLAQDLIEVIVVVLNLGAGVDIVAADFSPHDAAADEVIALHLCIDTCHGLVNIRLLVPEVVLGHHVTRCDLQEV